eukprot:4746993-Amphidinium_carterae.1
MELAKGSQDSTMGFAGERGFGVDTLMALRPTETEDAEEENEEESEKESEKEDEGKKGASKWFDLAAGIAKGRRSTLAAMQKLMGALEQALTLQKDATAELTKLPAAVAEALTIEQAICAVRSGAVEHVLGDNEEAFKDAVFIDHSKLGVLQHEFLRTFDMGLGHAPGISPTKSKAGPPCREYMDLVPICVLQKCVESFETADSKAAIEIAKKSFLAYKKPLTSLLASCNAARNELVRGAQQLVRDEKTRAAGGKDEGTKKKRSEEFDAFLMLHILRRDAEKKGVAAPKLVVGLFDVVAEQALEIPVLRLVSDARPVGVPYILPRESLAKELDAASAVGFSDDMDKLKADVSKAAQSQESIRASRAVSEEVAKGTRSWLLHAAPEQQVDCEMLGITNKMLLQQLQPQVFCTSASPVVSCQA